MERSTNRRRATGVPTGRHHVGELCEELRQLKHDPFRCPVIYPGTLTDTWPVAELRHGVNDRVQQRILRNLSDTPEDIDAIAPTTDPAQRM